jgi:hypothetical protein
VPPGIYFNIILLLRLGLQSGVSLRFPDQSPVFALPLPIRATCFAHCSFFDLWSIVNTVMNTEFPKEVGNFFTAFFEVLCSLDLIQNVELFSHFLLLIVNDGDLWALHVVLFEDFVATVEENFK